MMNTMFKWINYTSSSHLSPPHALHDCWIGLVLGDDEMDEALTPYYECTKRLGVGVERTSTLNSSLLVEPRRNKNRRCMELNLNTHLLQTVTCDVRSSVLYSIFDIWTYLLLDDDGDGD